MSAPSRHPLEPEQEALFQNPVREGHPQLGDPAPHEREHPTVVEPNVSEELEALRQEREQWRTERERAQQDNARLQGELEQARRSMDHLIGGIGSRQQPAAPEPEPLAPAPDPVQDPKGYEQWLEQRLARERQMATREAEKSANQRMSRLEMTTALNNLWSTFQGRYPEYAGMVDEAQNAFLLETNGGQVTLDQLNSPDAMIERVKGRMDTMRDRFLQSQAPQESEGEEPAIKGGPPAPQGPRSSGVSRGGPRAARRPAAPSPKDEPVRSFADCISDWQVNSEYF